MLPPPVGAGRRHLDVGGHPQRGRLGVRPDVDAADLQAGAGRRAGAADHPAVRHGVAGQGRMGVADE